MLCFDSKQDRYLMSSEALNMSIANTKNKEDNTSSQKPVNVETNVKDINEKLWQLCSIL